MNRAKIIFLAAAVLIFLAACGPTVVVENRTGFAVRAVVTHSGGSEVVSPSPGESSAVDADEGAYRVTVIPDEEWIAWAKLTRKVLNDQLANSENLTGPQLLEVVRRLKEIAAKMQQFENAAGKGSSCSGSLSSDGGGIVVVSTGTGGTLIVSCK